MHSKELKNAASERLERRLLRRERELDAELKRLLLNRKTSFARRADTEEPLEEARCGKPGRPKWSSPKKRPATVP